MQHIIRLVIINAILAAGTAIAADKPAAKAPAKPKVPQPATAEMIEKITAAAPAKAPATPAKPRKILVFDKCEGFVHGCIPVANKAIEILGQKSGAYTVVISADMAQFTADNLKQYDAILFNNSTGLKFADPAQREALLDFVKSGKGIIGIHAASDNFPGWQEAQDMMGGCFDGHPWTAAGTWAVKVDDPKNPINKSFNGQGFKIKDEIYQVKGAYSREKFRVLLSLDMSDPTTANANLQKQKRADKDNGIAWIHPYGQGRVFYCSLGHNNDVFWDPAVLAHYLAGIQYALGDLKVDDSPSNK